jgi:arylsulfatase A-like enzyme
MRIGFTIAGLICWNLAMPLWIVCLLAFVWAVAGATPKGPNFIIIMADDLGYGDLGCYGHPSIRTPHLDRMAREGMRFTDFYSSAEVCTPSRAGLLTGRYPIRSGMCGDQPRVLTARAKGGLPREEITLAEALKERGYATACIGKWHLGSKPQHHPKHHGFDYYFGLPYSNDMPLHTNLPPGSTGSLNPRNELFDVPLRRNEDVIETTARQDTLTKRYTEEALRFMRENREHPFFIYLPHTFPHVPLFASAEFRGRSARGLYGDVVEELDWSVGQILEGLRREGLAENTLVVFTSDNGPWLTQKLAGGSAGLLRDGKGSTWEGGMRVPCIAWWPGRINSGQITSALACNLDFFPTCLKLAGAETPRDRVIDGIDLGAVLFGNRGPQRDDFLYYRGAQLFAVRVGVMKAHFQTKPAYGKEEAKKHDPPLLFNLAEDPSERFDVAANHSEALAQIARVVEKHRTTLKPSRSQLDD